MKTRNEERSYRTKSEASGSSFGFYMPLSTFLTHNLFYHLMTPRPTMKTSEKQRGGKLVAHTLRAFPPHNERDKVTHNKQHLPLALPLNHCNFIFWLNGKDQH